jgi:hypothetical protein
MAILCDFKPVGIEGMSLWRVAASCSNKRRWFGASKSQVFIIPVKSTTATTTIKENYDK